MEIHTSLDEIIDTLKKLKDAVPADFHHQDVVKQDIVTLTIETNLRRGDLETRVDGTKGDVTETETESALLFLVYNVFQFTICFWVCVVTALV